MVVVEDGAVIHTQNAFFVDDKITTNSAMFFCLVPKIYNNGFFSYTMPFVVESIFATEMILSLKMKFRLIIIFAFLLSLLVSCNDGVQEAFSEPENYELLTVDTPDYTINTDREGILHA